jgi:hypothetical protein
MGEFRKCVSYAIIFSIIKKTKGTGSGIHDVWQDAIECLRSKILKKNFWKKNLRMTAGRSFLKAGLKETQLFLYWVVS